MNILSDNRDNSANPFSLPWPQHPVDDFIAYMTQRASRSNSGSSQNARKRRVTGDHPERAADGAPGDLNTLIYGAAQLGVFVWPGVAGFFHGVDPDGSLSFTWRRSEAPSWLSRPFQFGMSNSFVR